MIREELGFQGALMTDDIGMEALSGTMGQRARASLLAGVDLVLYCKGDREELESTVSACNPLEGRALERCVRALAHRRPPEPADIMALVEELHDLVPEGT
jgi:beta-N-acetylhexosaminidase